MKEHPFAKEFERKWSQQGLQGLQDIQDKIHRREYLRQQKLQESDCEI